jgi:hypothetical protein
MHVAVRLLFEPVKYPGLIEGWETGIERWGEGRKKPVKEAR